MPVTLGVEWRWIHALNIIESNLNFQPISLWEIRRPQEVREFSEIVADLLMEAHQQPLSCISSGAAGIKLGS